MKAGSFRLSKIGLTVKTGLKFLLFKITIKFIKFSCFNSANPILLTALDNENLLTNDHDELVEEINMLMFTMSLYLVLIAIWVYILTIKVNIIVTVKQYPKPKSPCTHFYIFELMDDAQLVKKT